MKDKLGISALNRSQRSSNIAEIIDILGNSKATLPRVRLTKHESKKTNRRR